MDDKQSLKDILKDLLAIFPFPQIIDLVEQLDDPLDSKDTAQLLDIVQKNIDLLEKKQSLIERAYPHDEKILNSYMENPNNFSNEQWKAISQTKQAIFDYQKRVDMAVETGAIRQVAIEGKKTKKRKKKSQKRFKQRKKWISMD